MSPEGPREISEVEEVGTAKINEQMLTPEETEFVAQLAERADVVKKAYEELTQGDFADAKSRAEASHKVSDAVGKYLMGYIPLLVGGSVLTLATAGGALLLETSILAALGTGATAMLSAPLIAACEAVESCLKNGKASREERDILARKISEGVAEYEHLVSASRGVVTEAMIRGGATRNVVDRFSNEGKGGWYKKEEITATEAQKEEAQKEMEGDLAQRNEAE